MFRYHIRICFVSINLFKWIFGELPNVNNNCDLNFNTENFFEDIENVEGKYAEARKAFHNLVGGSEFDDKMAQMLISQRGAAVRTVYDHSQSAPNTIPAGINLGGHVIMRLERTILMFYHMMLKNQTVFQLNSIENNFEDMALNADLRLNDLQLIGTYSSCLRKRQSKRPHDYYLNCQPKFGQVELLLRNVRYTLQGRYRLLRDKLKLEHIVSKLDIEHLDVSLPDEPSSRRENNNVEKETVWRSSLDEFIVRLKTDLDQWMLDYFNDYLMYYVDLGNQPEVDNFLQYDVQRTKIINGFVDNTIHVLTNRLRDIYETYLQIPDYSLSPSTPMTMLELVHGRVMGLDSMYRQSVATVSPGEDVREVNAVVGFSNMKVVYSYDLVRNKRPYKGLIVLTADDLTAQLSIKIDKLPIRRKDSKQVTVKLKIFKVAQTNFITVKGVGILPPLRSLLENHIKSIMAGTIVKAIKNIGSVAGCDSSILLEPFTFDVHSDNNTLSDDEDQEVDAETKNVQNKLRNDKRNNC